MYNKQDIIEKTKKDHMYIVHGHKARVSERGGGMRERERAGKYERKRERGGRGGGQERVEISNTYFVSGHSNIDHDLLKVVLHSDRYRSPSATYTIRALSLMTNVSLKEDEGYCLDNG